MSMNNNKQKRVETGDAVQMIANQGKELLNEGNRRRVIARYPDGRVLLDISMTTAVVVAALVVMFMPFGWLVIGGVAAFGISQKIKLDFVRELGDGDENATISGSKSTTSSREDRLSSDSDGDTVVEGEPVKRRRKQS
jgi:hypothetical protein